MLVFLIKMTLCWMLCALLYRVLLRSETFFKANRAYLLLTSIGGLIAPLLVHTVTVSVEQAIVPIITLDEITVFAENKSTLFDTNFWGWLYATGVIVGILKLAKGLGFIANLALFGQKNRLSGSIVLVRHEKINHPFSFFNWVFVPSDYYENDPKHQAIIQHECAHAHGWHSVDVLVVELLCIVCWFHPLAHWYRRSIRVVHEYLADAAAAHTTNKKQYGLLLIEQSSFEGQIACVNHFYQSPLKQRLIMLTKKASAPVKAIKYGLVIPIIMLFVLLFRQAPVMAQAIDQNHLEFVHNLESKGWIMTDTIITFNPDTYEETTKIVVNNTAPAPDETGEILYRYCEVNPMFPGGQKALADFLSNNIKYPSDAKSKKLETVVTVRFTVDDDGTISNVTGNSMIFTENGDYDSMTREAVRVVNTMPKWIPGKHKGKTVRAIVSLPIKFALK